MEARISELLAQGDFKEGLRRTCRANRVPVTALNGLTSRRLAQIHSRIQKHYALNPLRAATVWFENELRLFRWVLIIEAHLSATPLTHFTQRNWDTLAPIFPRKTTSLFQFEARKLMGSRTKQFPRVWSPQECKALSQAVATLMGPEGLPAGFNSWNEVARRFFQISRGAFFRSGKQCREQWFNHLDGSKSHGEWRPEEDVAILTFALRWGHRWAQMSKEALPHRTEHMLKNRFKSLLAQQRRLPHSQHQHERKIIRRTLNKINSQNQTPPSAAAGDDSQGQSPGQGQQGSPAAPLPKWEDLPLPNMPSTLSLDNPITSFQPPHPRDPKPPPAPANPPHPLYHPAPHPHPAPQPPPSPFYLWLPLPTPPLYLYANCLPPSCYLYLHEGNEPTREGQTVVGGSDNLRPW